MFRLQHPNEPSLPSDGPTINLRWLAERAQRRERLSEIADSAARTDGTERFREIQEAYEMLRG